jgi:hypothetical protein
MEAGEAQPRRAGVDAMTLADIEQMGVEAFLATSARVCAQARIDPRRCGVGTSRKATEDSDH